MYIKSGYIDWMEGYHNPANIVLEMDEFELPNLKNFRFEEKQGNYYAELNDYVRYYHYMRPDSGFGGRHFPITMKDGAEKILKGPWSSKAGVMNAIGFIPCVDVTIKVDKYTLYAAAITLRFLLENLHKIKFTNFDFGRNVTPVIFPEGSKLSMGVFHWSSKDNTQTLLFAGASGEQTIDSNNGDIVYKPMIRLPDGTHWEKTAYVNAEWKKMYG